MTSFSLPMNLILVTGERELRDFVSRLKEGGSLGQKIMGFLFPVRKMAQRGRGMYYMWNFRG